MLPAISPSLPGPELEVIWNGELLRSPHRRTVHVVRLIEVGVLAPPLVRLAVRLAARALRRRGTHYATFRNRRFASTISPHEGRRVLSVILSVGLSPAISHLAYFVMNSSLKNSFANPARVARKAFMGERESCRQRNPLTNVCRRHVWRISRQAGSAEVCAARWRPATKRNVSVLPPQMNILRILVYAARNVAIKPPIMATEFIVNQQLIAALAAALLSSNTFLNAILERPRDKSGLQPRCDL